METYKIVPLNAPKFIEWLDTRGGLAVWESQLIGEPPRSWTGPVNDKEGNPTRSPDWRCGDKPARIITSYDEVEVEFLRELEVWVGCSPKQCEKKLTKLQKQFPDAFYMYESRGVVAYKVNGYVSLKQWKEQHAAKVS